MKSRIIILFAVGLFLINPALEAKASLIGDPISCADLVVVLGTCTFASGVIGPGVDLVAQLSGGGIFSIDIGASSISYTADNGTALGGFWGLFINNLNWVGDPGIITGITNFSSTVDTGLFVGPPNGVIGIGVTEAAVSVGENSVNLDLGGVPDFRGLSGATWDVGDTVSFDLVTQHTPVPTPSAMLLMGSGLVGLVGWRWWNRTRA